MTVLSGQNRGPGGPANPIGAEAIGENQALLGNAINRRRRSNLVKKSAGIAGNGIRSVIVGKEEKNIGAFLGARHPRKEAECREESTLGPKAEGHVHKVVCGLDGKTMERPGYSAFFRRMLKYEKSPENESPGFSKLIKPYSLSAR